VDDTTAFLFAALFSILPRNIIIKESKELNYTFVKVVPCISYSHHLILNMLKGRAANRNAVVNVNSNLMVSAKNILLFLKINIT
jgi:hypothetical protein